MGNGYKYHAKLWHENYLTLDIDQSPILTQMLSFVLHEYFPCKQISMLWLMLVSWFGCCVQCY